MNKIVYLAVLEPNEKDGGYSVYFPDLPGCISYGKDILEAQKMAKEALELHIYGMKEDKEELPTPTLSGLKVSHGDIVTPVVIFPDLVKDEIDNHKVKTNCTIPYGLKKIAEKEGINFSYELQQAIKAKLNIESKML